MKRARKKSKVSTPPETRSKDEKAPKPAANDTQNFEDGRMDFGGLPNRDLKKNLGGCG